MASVLVKAGFAEEVVIAGLLLDIIEDSSFTAEDIRQRFGQRVVEIALGVTEDKSLTWDERRDRYNARLSSRDRDVVAMSAADLLANRISLLREFQASGNPWKSFSRNPKAYEEKRIRFDLGRIAIIKEKLDHTFVKELELAESQVVELTN